MLIVIVAAVLGMLLTANPSYACQCLSRTPGFSGNHPDITDQYLDFDGKTYLPVCGKKLDTVDTTACSAIQALCVDVGTEAAEEGVPPQLLQLIRQIAAARLNLRATWTENGGCTQEITNLVGECDQLCEDFTGGEVTLQQLKNSDCISQLDSEPATCEASSGDTIQTVDCEQND